MQGIILQKKQFIIIAAAVLMAAGFVVARYIPLSRKMMGTKQMIEVQQITIAQADEQQARMDGLESQIEEVKKRTENFDKNIPIERDLGGLLSSISELMKRHNLEDQQILPDKEVLSGDLYCIAVNIKCSGSLKQIFEFFESLQQTDRMMRIETVKLTNDPKYSGKVDLETKAIVYYRSEQYGL